MRLCDIVARVGVRCSKSKLIRPWFRAHDSDERNEMARHAFDAVLTVTLRKPDSPEYRRFSDDVKSRAKREYNETISGDEEVHAAYSLVQFPIQRGIPRKRNFMVSDGIGTT